MLLIHIAQKRIIMDNVHFSHTSNKDEHGLCMVMEYTYEKQDATITGHIGKEYLYHMYMFLWGGGGEVDG